MWPPVNQTLPSGGFFPPGAHSASPLATPTWGGGLPVTPGGGLPLAPPLALGAFPPYAGYADPALPAAAPHPSAGVLGPPPGTNLPPPPAGAPVLTTQPSKSEVPPPSVPAPGVLQGGGSAGPAAGADPAGVDILALLSGGTSAPPVTAPSPEPPDFTEVRVRMLTVRAYMQRHDLLGPAGLSYKAVAKSDLPKNLKSLRSSTEEGSDADREEPSRGDAGAAASGASPKPADLSAVERLVQNARIASPQTVPAQSPQARRPTPPALAALLSPGPKPPGGMLPPSTPNRAAGAAAGAFLLQLVKETDTPPKNGAEMGADLLQQLQGGKLAARSALNGTPDGKSAGSMLLETIKKESGGEGDDCILEARAHTDGKRYVKADGEWVVATGKYYCLFCRVFFDDLDEHLKSAHHHHNRRLWEAAHGQGAESIQMPAKWKPTLPAPRTEADIARDAAQALEREKELQARTLAERYPDPIEEWLAWVPVNEGEPGGERKLRCLLCSKWASGSAHSATGGSQEHKRNIDKYVHTHSQWYLENVVPQKRRWSTAPPQPLAYCPPSQLMQGAALFGGAPPLLPYPWQIAWSQELRQFYYWNVVTGATQWAPPA